MAEAPKRAWGNGREEIATYQVHTHHPMEVVDRAHEPAEDLSWVGSLRSVQRHLGSAYRPESPATGSAAEHRPQS